MKYYMKTLLILATLLILPVTGMSSSGGTVYKADVNVGNTASLQRGAKTFVNYCMGCHSAAYMRYNRMGQDLGLTDDMLSDNLIFTADFSKTEEGEMDKVGSLMKIAMRAEDAKKWFGTAVPDLSVIARSRGADWLASYFRTFYVDEKGKMNNAQFPSVGMPHVLWELEGLKTGKLVEVEEHGHKVHKWEFTKISDGKLSAVEYEKTVTDLVNFLVYMGEPAQEKRKFIGIIVLLFLLLLFIVSYAMKKEFWKDVH